MKKNINKAADADQHLVQEELASALDTRFTQYAFMNLEDRALPDARDGLKPSQRRVLVAMNDLNLVASGGTEKCAKICGDTSGNYHPHGEAVVYPTMYRMAQPWVLRYPLLLGQGNFGNVDGDAPAAMRYCVTGDSLISSKGLSRIDLLSKNEDVDLIVESFEGNNHASKWFDCGEHPVKKITTRNKYSITGTLNHPLMTVSLVNDVPLYVWKTIEELKIGDYLVLKRGTSDPVLEQVNLANYIPLKENYSGKVKVTKLPSFLDENLAFVLGSLVAEGTTSSGNKLNFVNKNRKYFSKYRKCWFDIFGDNWSCSNGTRKSDNCKTSDSCGKYLLDFLNNIGLSKSTASNKVVPFTILQSPMNVIKSFLMGLYEGDGGITISPSDISFDLVLNSKSSELIRQVQILLLRFGIISSWYIDAKRKMYKLITKGKENFVKFENQIGFITKQKKLRLKAAIQYSSETVAQQKDLYPFVSQFVREKAIKHREFLCKNNFNCKNNWERHLPIIKEALTTVDFENINKIVRNDLFFNEITSIEDSGEQRVFSVKIDSECHSFIANGFVNHNTEGKLSRLGEAMLNDLSDDVVPFQPNYNEKRQEPTILPGLFPNLLANGCEGIAVGWATKMLPHNLREIAAVIREYIKNPNVTFEKLIKLMPGPDFPSGGKMLGQNGVLDYYKTGRGSIKLEGSHEIEKDSKGNFRIIITELPYQSSPDQLCTEIKNLVEADKLVGIADLKNLSSKKTGIRVVVDIAKNGNASLILNNLLRQTCLRKSISINTTVLIEGKVVPEANLIQLVKAFVDHRKIILTNKYQAELLKSEARIHILIGLIGIVDKIREVVKLIMDSENPEAAELALISKKYVSTPEQAKAVLAITLRQLTKLESNKLIEERDRLVERVKWLKNVLSNIDEILKLVSQEQEELAKKFGDDRRTIVVADAEDIKDEDLVKDEQLVISLTGDGYVRSVPLENYRLQNRGGTGSMAVNKADKPENTFEMFEANSKHLVLFFTNLGLVYQRKAYEIPVASKTGKGLHVSNLLSLDAGEFVTNMITIKGLDQKGHLIIVTKNGVIKKSEISDYDTNRKNSGLTAIALGMGDEVAFACVTDGKRDIFIVTAKGQCVRYSEKIVPIQARATRGSRALKLDYADAVAQVFTLDSNSTPDILVVTSGGFGKRTGSDEYKSFANRAVRGYSVIKKQTLIKNGDIVGACAVAKGDSLLTMTSSGKCIRLDSRDIRETGRTTGGVKIVKLDDNEAVVKIAKVAAPIEV